MKKENRASGLFPLFFEEGVTNKLVFWNYWALRGASIETSALTLRSASGEILGQQIFEEVWEGTTELVIEDSFPDICHELPQGYSASVELEFFYREKPRFTYPAVTLVYSSESASSLVHTSMRLLNEDEEVVDPFIDAPQTGFDVIFEDGVENKAIIFLGKAGAMDVKVTVAGPAHEVTKSFALRGEVASLHLLDLDFLDAGELQKIGTRPKVQIRGSQRDVFPRYFCTSRVSSIAVPTLTHSFFDVKAAVDSKPHMIAAARMEPLDNSMFSSAFLVPLLDPSVFETSIETYDCIAPFKGEVTLNVLSLEGHPLATRRLESCPGGFFQRRESIRIEEFFDLSSISRDSQLEMVLEVDGPIPQRQKVALNVKKRNQLMGTNICFAPHSNPDSNQDQATRHHWFPVGGKDNLFGTVHHSRYSRAMSSPRLFKMMVFTESRKNIVMEKVLEPGACIVISPQSTPSLFEKIEDELAYVYVESTGMPFDSYFFSLKDDYIGGDHAF